jgi:hypothetical protein
MSELLTDLPLVDVRALLKMQRKPAHRDAQPDEFDVTRTDRSRLHLVWGGGPHGA